MQSSNPGCMQRTPPSCFNITPWAAFTSPADHQHWSLLPWDMDTNHLNLLETPACTKWSPVCYWELSAHCALGMKEWESCLHKQYPNLVLFVLQNGWEEIRWVSVKEATVRKHTRERKKYNTGTSLMWIWISHELRLETRRKPPDLAEEVLCVS